MEKPFDNNMSRRGVMKIFRMNQVNILKSFVTAYLPKFKAGIVLEHVPYQKYSEFLIQNNQISIKSIHNNEYITII